MSFVDGVSWRGYNCVIVFTYTTNTFRPKNLVVHHMIFVNMSFVDGVSWLGSLLQTHIVVLSCLLK